IHPLHKSWTLPRSATRRFSSRRQWRAASPATRFMSTRATMRWGWRSVRRHRSRALSTALAAALGAGASACYRYAPLETAAIQPGAIVRLDLSASGASGLSPVLGAGTNAVEGTVLSAADSGYHMSVSGTRKASIEGIVSWAGEQVVIPRNAVEHVQIRSLDRRRTFGVAILGILAAVAVKVIV